MGRLRAFKYQDVSLKPADLTRLKKGYKVVKIYKDCRLSIFLDGRDRKVTKEINRLKARIKELEGKKK